jgi:hypothetical protein
MPPAGLLDGQSPTAEPGKVQKLQFPLLRVAVQLQGVQEEGAPAAVHRPVQHQQLSHFVQSTHHTVRLSEKTCALKCLQVLRVKRELIGSNATREGLNAFPIAASENST